MADQLGTLSRTHTCGELRLSHVGQRAVLLGWIHRVRDLGGLLFLDVRDRHGVTQVLVPNDSAVMAVAKRLRSEYVVAVLGPVERRSADTVNAKLDTGEVEVLAQEIRLLNEAKTPPFPVADDTPVSEDVRLKYRYLDLRRTGLQQNLVLRHKVTTVVRRFFDRNDFLEVETPILGKSTPEGARDYLVPSRVHAGEFYALPQSPQLFKQILMMAGMDRYYQIARCFRDEDLRADRQLEFTQLDMELAFVEERDVQDGVEAMIRDVFKSVVDVDLENPVPRMTYAEAMRRYGSDKPDLRVALELVDVAEHLKTTAFKVFSGPANDPGGRVAALRLPNGAAQPRKYLDDLGPYVAGFGAKGLAWIRIDDLAKGRDGMTSPIIKFLDDSALSAILAEVGAASGDVIFFGAGPYRTVSDFMGALRLKVARDCGLVENSWKPLWVTDFPMFEYDHEAKRYVALHHPFTAPKVDDIASLKADPINAVSRGYDMVLNGNEIGGGSIRIHRPDMQSAVLDLLGISADEAQVKFGFLLEALRYGAPPHGGIAFGIDRIAALMAGTDSIRDVIAFPKTATAQDLMTDAPSSVTEAQLQELHVRVVKPVKA